MILSGLDLVMLGLISSNTAEIDLTGVWQVILNTENGVNDTKSTDYSVGSSCQCFSWEEKLMYRVKSNHG